MLRALLESVIDAQTGNVVRHLVADQIQSAGGVCRHRRAVAKVDVEVFGLHTPAIHECPFQSATERPAAVILRSAKRSDRPSRSSGTCATNAAMPKGPATGHISEPVVLRVTDAAANSAEPFKLVRVGGCQTRDDGSSDNRRDNERSIGFLARPLKICFEAEDPLIDLPVVAELATADKSIQTIGVREYCRASGGGDQVIVLMSPAAAGVETDIKAGPIVSDRKRRHRCLRGHIRRPRRTHESEPGNRRKNNEHSFHLTPLELRKLRAATRKYYTVMPGTV